MSASSTPVLTRDPRFIAGRQLVGDEGAVEIFGSLLESARTKFGHDHMEAAPGYYEYGNALLRRRQRMIDNDNDPREAAAMAAEARIQHASRGGDSNVAGEAEAKLPPIAAERIDEDLILALEMMETAFSIMDKHIEEGQTLHSEWVKTQIPRVLTGLGDVLLELKRPADATDAYLRALAYRIQEAEAAATTDDVESLGKRRKVVEANILIVEALITAPLDHDLVTSETKDLLVKGGSVLEYAKGYYDKARDELQETLLLMGQLAARGVDLGSEKQDVCHVATMVMGAGNALAEIDEREEETNAKEPMKKKAKR